MHKMISIVVVALAAAACNSSGFRAVRAEAGPSYFQEDGLGPQPATGVGILFQDDLSTGNSAEGWVGDIALRVTGVQEDLGAADLTGNRVELDVGTRLYPYSGSKTYQPFLGFGGTIQRLHLDDEASDATVVDPGVYAVLGFDVALGDHLRLGLEYRHTFGIDAKLDTGDDETDLDSGTFLVSMGLGL